MSTKFEEIIDNPRIFKIILDEFFRGWPGSYDVMPVEDHEERFFKSHEKFAEFCRKVRTKAEGNERCMGCDVKYSQRAKEQKKPKYYMCHAGLMDIAVPIIIGDQLIATIFCGQSRPSDEKLDEIGIDLSLKTERELGFKEGELLELRAQTPVISEEQVEDLKSRLWEVATYVSKLGSSKLEAERAKRDLSNRLRETDAIQKILLELTEVLDDIDVFWSKLDIVLKKICEIIGADFGLFATCQTASSLRDRKGLVQSVANLPSDLVGRYLSCNPTIATALDEMRAIVNDLSETQFSGELIGEITGHLLNSQACKVAIVPIKLEPEHEGIMLFFLSSAKDTDKGLMIDDEMNLLTQAGTHIATAYGNCVLYQKQKELAEIQSDWLEDVSHQILAPLTGILGQTENLSRSFKLWQNTNPQRIDNTLTNLVELSDWATRMARNFAWVAKGANHPREINMRLEDDVPGKLIGYARNVQGLAKSQGIFRVHVDIDSVKNLNNRIVIDNKLFKQALTNLLDNSVKYAHPKTEVLITARVKESKAYNNIISF
jgi:ligand-binding sensor protein